MGGGAERELRAGSRARLRPGARHHLRPDLRVRAAMIGSSSSEPTPAACLSAGSPLLAPFIWRHRARPGSHHGLLSHTVAAKTDAPVQVRSNIFCTVTKLCT